MHYKLTICSRSIVSIECEDVMEVSGTIKDMMTVEVLSKFKPRKRQVTYIIEEVIVEY